MSFGCYFVFFKQKTAYEMRISDLSSDVCSSDLRISEERWPDGRALDHDHFFGFLLDWLAEAAPELAVVAAGHRVVHGGADFSAPVLVDAGRSEEHTSELQSLMRISYAVFCLKKKIHQST